MQEKISQKLTFSTVFKTKKRVDEASPPPPIKNKSELRFFFYRKCPILHHTCATYGSELPSYINTRRQTDGHG